MAQASGINITGEVVIEGILQKKTPGGLKGFKPWQKRYFVVTTKAITYHKTKGDEPKGRIPILEIKKVEYLPDKQMGARFDIIAKNGRVYSLHSECEEDTHIWVNAIRQAVLWAKKEVQCDEKKQSILDDTNKKYSSFQKLFFDAKFTPELMTKNKEKEKVQASILKEIESDFPGDYNVLKFLLHHIFNPDKKYFTYDRADEADAGFAGSDSVEHVLDVLKENGKISGAERNESLQILQNSMITDVWELIPPRSGDLSEIPLAIPKKIVAILQDIIEKLEKDTKNTTRKVNQLVIEGTRSEEEKVLDRIAQTMFDPAFIRNLVLVFSSREVDAHGLAVRALWAFYHGTESRSMANEKFCKMIGIHCDKSNLSVSTKDALMSILLLGHDVIMNIEPLGNIGFHRKVKCPAAFGALFAALKESDLEIRKLALADVTALLYENLGNCELIVKGNPWQAWMLSLLLDITKKDKNEEPYKTCYAFLINNVTLVLYQYFLQSENFPKVLNSTMLRLHHFGGSNLECNMITSTLLGALVNKLAAQKSQFGTDYKRTEWPNLFELLAVIKKYIFKTAYWQSNPLLGLVLDKVEGQDDGERDVFIVPPSPINAVLNMDESDFVLMKARPVKGERTWNSEGMGHDAEIKDFGLHWKPCDTGPCTDVELAKKTHQLFVKLGVDKFDAELSRDIDKTDKEYLILLEQQAMFWEDVHKFLNLHNRADIARKRLFTYRKLSFMCQTFMNAESRSTREREITKLNRLKAGQSAEDEDVGRPSVMS